MQALVQIIRRFGWTWVGLVVNDDDTGYYYARTMHSELERSGVACLAYVEYMGSGLLLYPSVQRVVTTMKESRARVVIYLAGFLQLVMEADNQWAEGVRSIFILGFIVMS